MKKVLLCFFLFSIVAATPIKDKWIPDSIYPYSDSLQTIVKITDATWGNSNRHHHSNLSNRWKVHHYTQK